MKKNQKKGLLSTVTISLIIGVIVIVIFVAGYLILKGKGIGLIDFVKNIFRFPKLRG